MPYIHYNKKTKKYRLFGSLPIMCKECNLDYSSLQYYFRNGKIKYKNKTVKIIKAELERGGKK